mgnify:FL=1
MKLVRITLLCKTLCVIALLIFSTQEAYLQSLVQPDSTDQPRERLSVSDTLISVGYGQYKVEEFTSAISVLSMEEFNQGLISDPALLMQGKIAGMQVYNRGGDPNLASLIRIRGLSGYAQRNPLIVIDGVPGASLQNLDPNDVAKITVLKDGSAQTIYGIRASNGVILIETHKGKDAQKALMVSYNGQAAFSSPYAGIPVLSADEFRAIGGTDFGASTNWLDEVRRNGTSQTHSLALSGRQANTHYRLSGNYRNVEGVLNKSGFEQLNARANLSSELFDEALKVHLSASYTDRNSQLGFVEAFRYAASANPTAPIFAVDAPFPYDTERFGGFFETNGLFDAYNPRALVDLNDRDGQLQVLTTAALLEYKLKPELSLNVRYAYQDEFSNERAYYSPQSLFRGTFFPIDETDGRAELDDRQDQFSLYELFANYQKTIGKTKWQFTLGTSYQDGEHLDNYLQLTGFSNPELIGIGRINDYQNWEQEAISTDTINNGWSDKLSAFYGRAHVNLDDKLMLNASLRYEGSSKLGENQKWGLFPSIGAAVDFTKLREMPNVDQFKLRLGYGITGGIPGQGGLSRNRIVLVEQDNVLQRQDTIRRANPDLKWEEKSEFNVGLDFQMGKLRGSLDWYSRKVKDWISPDPFFFRGSYLNQDAIRSSGIELALDATLYDSEDFTYTSGMILSSYQSKFVDLENDQRFATGVGGLIQDPSMPIVEGGELGDIKAAVFLVAAPDGFPAFDDVNQDGMIRTNTDDLLDPEGDFVIVGNGLPDFELGWYHQLQYQGWQLQALFRAAFGHSLVNRYRLTQEPETFFDRQNYNFVNTELAVENLRVRRFSSLYVEKADFLKLDFIQLSRTFSFGSGSKRRNLSISLTGQNLFVISNYTGVDPEPVLEDAGPTSNGSEQFDANNRNLLAPGIDRRNSYLPARTLVLGVGLVF